LFRGIPQLPNHKLEMRFRESRKTSRPGSFLQSGNLLSKRLDFQLMEGLDRWHLLAIR